MPEPEVTTEYEKKPLFTTYLSEDFLDQAPTDQGVRALTNYLDTNLRTEVKKQMEMLKIESFPLEEMPERRQEKIGSLLNEAAMLRSELLYQYAIHKMRSYTLDDEKHQQTNRAQVAALGEALDNHRVNMSMERQAVDILMERAASVPTDTGKTIEGRARLVSSTPTREG